MINCYIDNAVINSAVNIFRRLDGNQNVREINLLGLETILESYILYNSANIASNYFDHFIENTPVSWQQYYYEFFQRTDPINIEFNNFLNFIDCELVYYTLNLFLDHIKNNTRINEDIFSYTGNDFDAYPLARQHLQVINSELKKRWNWDYNPANPDHIDVVMFAYRTTEYLRMCQLNNFKFIAHPLRNEFLICIASYLNYSKQFDSIENFYSKIREKIFSNFDKSSEFDQLLIERLNLPLYRKLKFPMLTAIIFERSSNVKDIFRQASKLRVEFSGFRSKISEMEVNLVDGDYSKLDKSISELQSYVEQLQVGSQNSMTEFYLEVENLGDIKAGLTKKYLVPKYLRIFTSLASRYNLPHSYLVNSYRLFRYIRWNSTMRNLYDL